MINFDEEVGLLKTGSIVSYNSTRNILKIKLNNSSSLRGQSQPIEVPASHSLFFNNGLFVGTSPVAGTPVVVGQGSGGQYYLISILPENLPVIPALNSGELLIRSSDTTKISLNLNNDILIGSDNNRIHVNTKSNYVSTNFYNKNDFTQASRKIEGLIKRDLRPNTNYDQDSKLENDTYDSKMFVIAFDPTTSPNPIVTGSNKNPPFIEQREITYEFQPLSEVTNDLSESLLYGNTKPASQNFTFPNRRKGRADTLSLSLVEPNYLMELTKGTVIDIFGNILDLNRNPIPVGQDRNTIRAATSKDKIKSFSLIKALERKSLSYHFEINARKDLSGQNGQIQLPDITSNTDYARNRSRYFHDIDKEGQFKVNVPASSETGNISLLVRYENYSTFGPEDNNNPNKLIFRDDNLDIFLDSFAAPSFNINDGTFSADRGSIKLVNNGADGAPIDRITGSHIKHGTAYHDVLSTCYAHRKSDFLKYVADPDNPVFSQNVIDANIPIIKNIASDTIIVGGPGANAGGRSGSYSFDGSIDLNIGANTIDRQSIWLDTAGALIANIGRDLTNKSAAISMNGDFFFRIGGMGVSGDGRFAQQNNGQMGAVLDLRVFNSGLRVTLIRIDEQGIKILTPGNLAIHSSGNMRITSDTDIAIESETLSLQGRMVYKMGDGI